jgi:hypothetical protein
MMLDNDMPMPVDCRRIRYVSFRSKHSYFIHKSNALCCNTRYLYLWDDEFGEWSRLYRPYKNFMTYNWLHVAQTFLRKQPPSYSKTFYPVCNQKIHWRVHNSETLGPIYKHLNSLHIPAYRYLGIHFIIILSRVFTFPFRFCGKECTPFSYLPCMLHATLTLKLTYSFYFIK